MINPLIRERNNVVFTLKTILVDIIKADISMYDIAEAVPPNIITVIEEAYNKLPIIINETVVFLCIR